MQNKIKSQNAPLETILNTTIPTDRPEIYANHAQVVVTANEIIIDLFELSPMLKDKYQKITAIHMQRILLPLSLGKGFATAIANTIAAFEADNGFILPNNRTPDPDDKIVIWK